jgi:S-adenosylmethionine hydrolase
MQFISLLTDFGIHQEYAGVCRAVILSLCPAATIVDISHSVSSFDIQEGALMLKHFVAYSPAGVHVAVVDPGVGTQRRGIAVETERGDFFVGPDNGVLMEAADMLQVKRAAALENAAYMLKPVSSSFHGRDVFAPAAAYIANGVPVSALGTEVAASDLTRVCIPEPTEDKTALYTTVLRIDRFGNIQLNVGADTMAKGLVTVGIKGKKLEIPVATTFGDVAVGELLLYKDSDGLVTLAQNQGNAAHYLGVQKHEEILLYKQG